MSLELSWNFATPADRARWLYAAVGFKPKGGSDFFHVRWERIAPRVQVAIQSWSDNGQTKRIRLSKADLLPTA